ncbi:MAG: FAD-dependent oxidoreductase [Clostridiales bacterium]|nr:FAD-dependent oxidoreductase [Clostridiales bacterium]
MKSVWNETCSFPRREPLHGDFVTEAVVIGSGIAGILTASMLQKQGIRVMVLERGRTAAGVTGNTTAKITSQHGLIYSRLIREFGPELAAQYAWANQRAVKSYRELISGQKIDCDYEEKSAYVYTLRDEKAVEDEANAAQKLGIESEYVESLPELPFKVRAAVRFEHQAQFHPLEFLKALSSGLNIYEDTTVFDVRDDVVLTDKGRVTADHIIVATHFPIIDIPGWYFARMHQERSYVLALENAAQINGMYLDEDEQGCSLRSWRNLLLLGGAGHRTGKHPQTSCYDQLRRAAAAFYPQSREVCRWSSQDCVTWDGIPYIGRYSSSARRLYVATGFQKWGMTTAMAAAELITDLVMGRENNCSEIFSPRRFRASASMKKMMADAGCSAAGLAAGLFAPSHRCSHLGCGLQWNEEEETWDCPCHGSRFTADGKPIDTPAIKGLRHG